MEVEVMGEEEMEEEEMEEEKMEEEEMEVRLALPALMELQALAEEVAVLAEM